MSKCEHARKYPCSQCTNRLLHLLQARVSSNNLWQCDVDAIRSAVRGHPDFTACVHCGKGSTFYDPVERCSCKGGKTTLVHVAESRTDSGAQWQNEDVVDSKGRLFKGALLQACVHACAGERRATSTRDQHPLAPLPTAVFVAPASSITLDSSTPLQRAWLSPLRSAPLFCLCSTHTSRRKRPGVAAQLPLRRLQGKPHDAEPHQERGKTIGGAALSLWRRCRLDDMRSSLFSLRIYR